MNDLPAIIGGLSLLVGAIFTGLIGLDQRRKRLDQDVLNENDDYHRWRPLVRRAIVALRDRLAEHGIPEPEGIDDLIEWPPPRPKGRHAKGDEIVDDSR
ncbi:MAG TPA: hypothetical protein VIQ30_10985 [Pseudonocardia sp.]